MLGVVALLMAAWLAFVALVYGLGTCGEDSDLTGDEYRRLCGSPSGGGGVIGDRLTALTAVAALVVLAAAATIWLRRSSWGAVAVAAVVLLVLGSLGFQLDG